MMSSFHLNIVLVGWQCKHSKTQNVVQCTVWWWCNQILCIVFMQCTVLCCSVNTYQVGSENTYYVTFLCSALCCVALCWALGQQCKHITYQCSVGPFHLYQASQGGVNQMHGTAPTNKIHCYTCFSRLGKPHVRIFSVQPEFCRKGGGLNRLAKWVVAVL